ncbi:unnamed protein product, partial [Durusdinium trenchii]
CYMFQHRTMKRPLDGNQVAALEDVRLPISTMLFTQGVPSDSPQEFHVDATWIYGQTPQMQDTSVRVVQCRSLKALRLLQVTSPLTYPGCGSQAWAGPLGAAVARHLDGVYCNGIVVLLAPDHLVIVDDDKQEGLRQQLISDMFTQRSIDARWTDFRP